MPTKPKPDLVRFIPARQANQIVKDNGRRYAVYVDPNDQVDEQVSSPMLERHVAQQLVDAHHGEIDPEYLPDGDEDEEGEEEEDLQRDGMGGTVASSAARRVARNVDADNTGAGVSGADSRDTSAFARPPLQSGGQVPGTGSDDRGNEGDGEAGDYDDAPPVSAPAATKAAPAPKPSQKGKAAAPKKAAPAPKPSQKGKAAAPKKAAPAPKPDGDMGVKGAGEQTS